MQEKIAKFILPKLFVVSRQPVLLKDLLEANALFNEGMLIDPAKLNFRYRYGALYGVYVGLCGTLLLLALAVLHNTFTKIDFHYSIFATIIITSLVFVGFDAFRIWARKMKSKELIEIAWKNHFPYFPYEKYSRKIEEIYNEAMKDEVSRKDLEKYVLDKLVASAGETA